MSWLRKSDLSEQEIWNDVKHKNPEYQFRMVDRYIINDQSVLAQVVLESDWWKVRREALARISDRSILNTLLMDMSAEPNRSNMDFELMELINNRLGEFSKS